MTFSLLHFSAARFSADVQVMIYSVKATSYRYLNLQVPFEVILLYHIVLQNARYILHFV